MQLVPQRYSRLQTFVINLSFVPRINPDFKKLRHRPLPLFSKTDIGQFISIKDLKVTSYIKQIWIYLLLFID